MKENLRRIREPKALKSKKTDILVSLLIVLVGIALGILSKWLDDLAFDSTLRWHQIIEKLDLGNVFSSFPVWLLLALVIAVFARNATRAALNTFLFFAGMCAAYHLYTVGISGFNPAEYMMIWYAFTLISPLIAVFCWYAKGKTVPSIVLSALIFAVLANCCFSIGRWYFGFNGIVNLVIFIAAIPVLYASPKQIGIALPAGAVLALLISPLIPLG